MAGAASPAQLAAFAVLLRAKGETPEELAGLVQTMLTRSLPVVTDGLRSTSSAPAPTGRTR